jgi:hypothetical protein
MSRSEELRDDPSAGKSGASPSGTGTGTKSHTVFADPDTKTPPDLGQVPQVPPVPDVLRDLDEAKKLRQDRGPVSHMSED